MTASIRELKRNYKTALALGRVLPTHDRAIPLPLSTTDPLFDAALVGKIKATATLNEPEHLGRAWQLVRRASEAQIATLVAHRRRLLNDYKQLLAIGRWQVGDEERCRALLSALPWRWRLGFPTAIVKPASSIFTGWRRNLAFRLVDDPRFPALRELFRETLAAPPPVALLKYRNTVKEAAALLRFRFEGLSAKRIGRIVPGRSALKVAKKGGDILIRGERKLAFAVQRAGGELRKLGNTLTMPRGMGDALLTVERIDTLANLDPKRALALTEALDLPSDHPVFDAAERAEEDIRYARILADLLVELLVGVDADVARRLARTKARANRR